MNLDSASYSVRSFVSDWTTSSVSLPVEENDLSSKDQLGKKKVLMLSSLKFPIVYTGEKNFYPYCKAAREDLPK